ncbi:SCO6745 family protein [Rhodococcus sp. IEGM1428]|uniref:SCO6745 family protein n=1 Tax=Rhodococcus sp. IEGM1428 TaxID=3392191 RepID=UPI003D145639
MTTSTALARAAYKTLEPFHVTAYFNPELGTAYEDTGLDGHAWYVGARAAPMGPCAPSVVAAAFYNFNPVLIERAWPAAVAVGLDAVSDRRWALLDSVLGTALGSLADDPALATLAGRLGDIGDTASFAGRPLSAAWHSTERPDVPHLALWHSITVLREWRGDGHLAALIDAELDPTEAAVFHEAVRPTPQPGRRALGKRITQLTRQWSESEWDSAAERLATRGLLTTSADGETLTDNGTALDQHIEDRTDAMASAVWNNVSDAEQLITSARPYVKAVIDAGFLPGTKTKAS